MTGFVQSLHVYPVKGMRGLDLDAAPVARHGIHGDRRWMVTDPDGRFLTQRAVAGMARLDALPAGAGLLLRHGGREPAVARPGPGGALLDATIWNSRVPVACAGAAVGAWLSEALGVACRLVFMADARCRPVAPGWGRPGDHVSLADEFPLLATSHASLDALNALLARPVPMDRFRAGVTLAGLPPWAEDRWRRVRIGTMVFRAPKPCTRCVVVTRDQRNGDTPDPGEPLRTLARLNRRAGGIVFGANLIPEAPGRLGVGDRVEVLERADGT